MHRPKALLLNANTLRPDGDDDAEAGLAKDTLEIAIVTGSHWRVRNFAVALANAATFGGVEFRPRVVVVVRQVVTGRAVISFRAVTPEAYVERLRP
jgi:hypothetical protein